MIVDQMYDSASKPHHLTRDYIRKQYESSQPQDWSLLSVAKLRDDWGLGKAEGHPHELRLFS